MIFDKLVLSVYFKNSNYLLDLDKLERMSADRNYEHLYSYKSSDYITLKVGKRDNQANNPDMMIYVNQAGCRGLANPFNALKEMYILNFGEVEKETISRIDIACDMNLSTYEILKGLELKGKFKGAMIHEDENKKPTWKAWGKADNLQICIYDKKKDLIENYNNTAWGFDQLTKLDGKELLRLEIRIGKRYFKQLKFKNEKNGVFKHLSQILNNIYHRQIETNKTAFNAQIKEILSIQEKAEKIGNRSKYLEHIIEDHKNRLMRAFITLTVLKKKLSLRKIFIQIWRSIWNMKNI